MVALIKIALHLVTEVFRLAVVLCRPTRSVQAENLFLRRQLALLKERGAQPRRVDAATRISLATLARFFEGRDALYVVQPKTMIRWQRATLLKRQIPIRTFAEWNEARPGFVEIDLVGHDGGDASGDFCQILNVTDVASAWTENAAVINKAQVWVFGALKDIRARLPFPLLGIDSDNGSEFINNHLLRYCRQEKITFTRGCAGKKNDGCFVCCGARQRSNSLPLFAAISHGTASWSNRPE